ncbi:MAG: hypothetical protein CMN93_07650 [Synechococcus sp. CPC35]|nr:hypothetical protein [Synechococcus sp. CPC35]
MSRESFKDFIHSIDHNQSLRRQVAACENEEDLIAIAKSNHFNITKEDISADKKNSEAAKWFETSKINKSFHQNGNDQ